MTPVDIEIRRADDVAVTFDDGVTCVFPVRELRANCPCATCRGWRERGEVAWPRPQQSAEITIVNAELAGAWGLSIDWSDGHSTGIYAWSVLRRWWDSNFSEPLVIDPMPGHPDGPHR